MLSLKRFVRSAVPLAAAVFLAAVVAVGCGGDDDDDDSGSAAKSDAPAKIEGTVQWSMLDYDPKVKEWANGVIDAFESKHPGVEIELTLPPVNSYQQLLTTRFRGKNPPDIAAVPTAWVPAFAEADALVPWTERVDDDFLSAIEPTLLDGAKIDGELFALPYLSTSRALFWNETAFEKAGLDGAPATWDDLIADGKEIQSSGAAKHGFALQGTGNEAFSAWFPYVYWSHGGELADADGKLAIAEDACTQGTSILDRMVREKVTQPNVTAADLPEQLGLFVSGDAAMTITGPWLVGQLAAEAKDLQYGVAPIPSGSDSTTLDVQDAFVLFKDGKNLDAATEFAKFLFEPENADQLVEGRGMLPVLTAGFDAPRYQEEPLKTFVDLVRDGKFVPSDPRWLGVTDTGARALQAMYTDGKSPEQTCAEIIGAAG